MLWNGLGGRAVVPWGQAFESAWQQYGATHPEWFALAPDGTRGCQHLSNCGDQTQYVKVDPTSQSMATHVAAQLGAGAIGVTACEDDSDSGKTHSYTYPAPSFTSFIYLHLDLVPVLVESSLY